MRSLPNVRNMRPRKRLSLALARGERVRMGFLLRQERNAFPGVASGKGADTACGPGGGCGAAELGVGRLCVACAGAGVASVSAVGALGVVVEEEVLGEVPGCRDVRCRSCRSETK